jgi:hypothetical protein
MSGVLTQAQLKGLLHYDPYTCAYLAAKRELHAGCTI